MHRVRHPLLEKAKRIVAELEWERAACEVCSSRGSIGSAGHASLARGDEPEPCPACLGVSFVWLDRHRLIFNVEELVEDYERTRGPGQPSAPDTPGDRE